MNRTELTEDTIKSFQSMLIFNDNLRKNIQLSLSLYKQLKNFTHNNIHKFFDEPTSTK
ncbi:MAG: hypothetical protein Gaeavirus10_10 [Gaeavirus sp.]|uniref:Uncharacterized protein n=1 Tax=Gaeavirus sp. TaxID=2487767 RepID=A0A3G5A0V3_9VIRU|nr:MAG: hypothetical protein Gaeavirus10_10 [Gaeavirus sp.]